MGRREREKKARRSAERDALAEAGPPGPGEPGGMFGGNPDQIGPPQSAIAAILAHAESQLTQAAGDHWASRPGGKGEPENARLVRQAARWNTAATSDTFAHAEPGKLTARDVAVMVTRRGMLTAPERVVPTHVSNLIRMEGENQRDQLAEDKADPFAGNLGAAAAAGAAAAGAVAGAAAAGLDASDEPSRPLIAIYLPDNGRSLKPITPIILDPADMPAAESNGHAGKNGQSDSA